MAKRDILHYGNPGYWNKYGHRIPGVNTDFDISQPKTYWININDENVTKRIRAVADIVHKALEAGTDMDHIVIKLTSSKLYGDFIAKYHFSYNQVNQTRYNRYEMIRIIHDTYYSQDKSVQENKKEDFDNTDGPEEPEN